MSHCKKKFCNHKSSLICFDEKRRIMKSVYVGKGMTTLLKNHESDVAVVFALWCPYGKNVFEFSLQHFLLLSAVTV